MSKSRSYFISNTIIYGETLCNSVQSMEGLLHWGRGHLIGDMSAIYMHNHWTKLVDWTSGLDWWTQLKSLSVSTLLGYEAITTVPALSTDLEPSRRYLRLVSSTDPSYHALLENWRGKKRLEDLVNRHCSRCSGRMWGIH